MTSKFLTILLTALLMPLAAMALSPQQVIDKAAARLNNAESVKASFSGSTSGTLTAAGNKFAIVAGGFGIWYNGKDMWTYSKKAGETNLTTPTKAELLETNPIEIIKSNSSRFTPSKVSQSGKTYTLKLTPKEPKKNNVKTATLVIDTQTWLPVSIDMVFTNDSRMTINISSIEVGGAVAANQFVYPEKKYPGVEVVDLR